MKKQFILKIATIVMSVIIFFTGIGATVVNFCCDNCADQFLTELSFSSCESDEHIVQQSCCEEMAEADHSAQKICLKDANATDDDCCSVERYSIDIDSFHSNPFVLQMVALQSFVWIQSSVLNLQESFLSRIASTALEWHIKSPPEIFTTRGYLAFIRILII